MDKYINKLGMFSCIRDMIKFEDKIGMVNYFKYYGFFCRNLCMGVVYGICFLRG